jgi:hypothetical protein
MSERATDSQLLSCDTNELKPDVHGKQDGKPSPINHPNFIPDASTKFSDPRSKPKAFLMESKPPVGPVDSNGNKTKVQVSEN